MMKCRCLDFAMLLVALFFLSQNCMAENLLHNSSFEKEIPVTKKTWKFQQLENWMFYLNSGQKKCDISVVSPGYQSAKAIKLHTLGKSGFCSAHDTTDFAVKGGQQVYCSVWLRGKGKGFIRVYYLDQDGKRLKQYFMRGLKATDQWQKLECKFTLPADVKKIRFSLETLFDDAEVIFDEPVLKILAGTLLENASLRINVNPRIGGCIDSFQDKKKGLEFTAPVTLTNAGGLVNCIIPDRRTPGLCSKTAYDWKIIRPDREMQCTYRIPQGPMSGLEIRKHFLLDERLPEVTVRISLINHSAKEMKIPARIQNCISSDPGIWSWPTPDWVTIFRHDGKPLNGLVQAKHDLFRAGWQAKYYTGSGTTLKLSADVKDIRRFYCYFSLPPYCSTMEWYCREIRLLPGAAKDIRLKIELLSQQKQYYADSHGRKQKTEEIKAVRMPEPIPHSRLPEQFTDFFTFTANLGNLNEPEMAGLPDGRYPDLYCRIVRRLIRELSDSYFNTVSSGRILFDNIQQANWKNSRDYIGEVLEEQQMRCVPSTLFLYRKDLDVAKYMKESWPAKQDLMTRPLITKFIQKHQKRIPAIFTGDELLPQNVDVMLKVHEELKKILPDHILPIPYLNSSSTDLAPYLPIFIGDWYPIKRSNDSGRNPWNVYPEFRRVVQAAGPNTPVWFMPQGFGALSEDGPSTYALPTSGEYRLMLHLAIAAGIRGVAWHGFPNSTWPWMKNYSMYPYAPMGGAGQHHPNWKGIADVARTLAAVGPLLTRSHSVPLPADIRVTSGKFISRNQYYNGDAILAYALKTPKGMIIMAVNQNPDNPERGSIRIAGKNIFDLQTQQKLSVRKEYPLQLKAGDARYFYCGADREELNLCTRSLFQAEAARYQLLYIKAKGDRIPARTAAECRAADPRTALRTLLQERRNLEKRISQAPLGKVLQQLAEVRERLDFINFRLCCAARLVITPEMRKNTRRYRRWCDHPDAQYNELKKQLVKQFETYYRLADTLADGLGSAKIAGEAAALHQQALPIVQKMEEWLKKNPRQNLIDDPFEGHPNH